jgi:hypothetical protein
VPSSAQVAPSVGQGPLLVQNTFESLTKMALGWFWLWASLVRHPPAVHVPLHTGEHVKLT